MLQAVLLWAQDDAPQRLPLLANPIVWMGLIMLFMFIVVLPGQRRRDRERLALQSGVEKNDRILTIAGIYGTVTSVSDKEDEIVVKVDDNVRLRMTRASVARNLTKEEKAKQPQAEKAASK
jgi:preprotein translocase subunit YajC